MQAIRALRTLFVGDWSRAFQDFTSQGAQFAAEADKDSAELKYADAASKYQKSAQAYGKAGALRPDENSGIDTGPKVAEAQALEQFMLGRSFLELGRAVELEKKDANQAYFNAVGHFDEMEKIAKATPGATEALSKRAMEAHILSDYAAGMGYFELGRHADVNNLLSRGGSFLQAWASFNTMLDTAPDSAAVSGLLPAQKNELLVKRSIATGEAYLGHGATLASDHINSSEKGSFQEQADACKSATAAFNEALFISPAPRDLVEEAKAGRVRSEKYGAQLQDWMKIGAELGSPDKPLKNCREILEWCDGEIYHSHSIDKKLGTEGKGETFAEAASRWQTGADRVSRAQLLLEGMLTLANFPQSLVARTNQSIAYAELLGNTLSNCAEIERTWGNVAEHRQAGDSLVEVMRWAKDPARPVSPTDSESSEPAVPDATPAAKGLEPDTAASPALRRPASALLNEEAVGKAGTPAPKNESKEKRLLPAILADSEKPVAPGSASGPRPRSVKPMTDDVASKGPARIR